MKKFKHLKAKKEFTFDHIEAGLLEWFDNPGVDLVTLVNSEFTSLCPVTGQPDYSAVTVSYIPGKRCVESKSLKLYLGSFRNCGSFTETVAARVAEDLRNLLECNVTVKVSSVPRGGISVSATSTARCPI